MKFDWKATLKTVAPALAGALGTPLTGLATKAVLDAILPGKENANETDIAAAIQGATPDQLLALKEADHKFQVDMERIGVDLEKISVEDRKSARKMASETSLWPQIILSCIYIGGYFAVLILFMLGDIHIDKDYIGTFKGLLGLLSAPNLTILHFWFGSTRGSSEKTFLLAGR